MTPEAGGDDVVRLDRLAGVEASGPQRRYVTEEFMRAALAWAFVGIFTLTIAAAGIGAFWGHWKNLKELLQIVLPPEAALLGSAVGYYFGTMQRGASK